MKNQDSQKLKNFKERWLLELWNVFLKKRSLVNNFKQYQKKMYQFSLSAVTRLN